MSVVYRIRNIVSENRRKQILSFFVCEKLLDPGILFFMSMINVDPRVKGTVSRDFLLLVFLMNQFPPSPRVLHLDRFKFFRKIRGDNRKSMCTIGINDTGGKFATGVNDTGSKIAAGITTPAANLPPVSTTPVANFATSSPCVVDTGGK